MKKLVQAILLTAIFASSIGTAAARSGIYYGGGQHTYSHGGTYVGGVGSSHRGGTYQNPATGNQYGSHQ